MLQFLNLKSYRGFRNTTIEFPNIMCIIGENSTGKSTIIQAIQNLLTSDNAIPQNHCKVGINDNNTTSLLLALQNGMELSKNIQRGNRENPNSLPECITSISPAQASYSFPLENNNGYNKLIKNHKIKDETWRNILSHCDFTLGTAAESTTTISDAMRFNKERILGISEKFTNDFNNVLEGSIGRKYKFEVVFGKEGNQLVVQLHISYRESDRESDKQSSWVDLNYESIGFRTLITLCSYLLNDQDRSKKIFVMDEPFTNIHPKAQRHVSRMLQSLSQRFQIIYATHSPHLLPDRDKVICTLTEAAGDLSICKFEEYPLNLFYDLSPLALEYIEETESESSTINVIVEGVPDTDKKVYERLFELRGISDITNVISAGPNRQIVHYARSYRHNNIPCLCILDPGEKVENRKELERIRDENDNRYLLPLSVQENNHMKKGIENLMPNHIVEKAYKELGRIVRFSTKEYHGEEPVEEYVVHNNNKKKLVDFFLNEAGEDDYKFFGEVIDEITKIREKFGI